MINLTATKIDGTDNGWLVQEVQEVDGGTHLLSKQKVFCNAANNSAEAAISMFPVKKRHIEKARIVDAPKMKEIEVSGKPSVEIMDGKAVMRPGKPEKKMVQDFDEYEVVDESGKPVMQKVGKDEKTGQPIFEKCKPHRVPKTEKKLAYVVEKVQLSTPTLPKQKKGESEADYQNRCHAEAAKQLNYQFKAAENAAVQEIEQLRKSLPKRK
jgi:hypothetical protein